MGPKTLANPKPTRVGKGGPGGRALWQGVVGGVPPQTQKRERVAHISNQATEWDPKPWQTLSPRGWENRGVQRAKPYGWGSWGACPPLEDNIDNVIINSYHCEQEAINSIQHPSMAWEEAA